MHLLELKHRGELSLTKDLIDNIPPYAILSHTWGDDEEEVTFRDLMQGVGKDKAGYRKIQFCREQATKDGIRYIWVDTCCIDKSNNNELSEAINSMFRWYRAAAKCYVYLSDVSTQNSDADDHMFERTCERALRESRWFTRGWTLQELIAPLLVEFFSREGKRLGDKKSLEKQLHEITGIPTLALQGKPLSHFSIPERMSWANHRETKRKEDKAYSLMGIFGIHMPLIYGEGSERAIIRLREEIDRPSRNSQLEKLLHVPRAVLQAAWIVPFDRNPNFTGRGTQLAEVEEKLFVEGRTNKCTIWGLGGVGKTQLLLELVYRIRDKQKNCSVIWIPAANKESLQQAYLGIARGLGIPGSEEIKADVKRLVQNYLSKESTGQWPLAFDNADDIDMWISKPGSAQESDHLMDYMPRSKQGSIVFTTRDRKTAARLAQQSIVEVLQMDEQIATQLLRKCLVDKDPTDKDTKALLAQLTYLPLAIVQAASYINENNIAIIDYLSLLEDQEEKVIDLLSEEFEDDRRYCNTKNPIATTWLVSFEQIRRRDPLAAEILSFMACVDAKDVPQSLLPPGTSRRKEIEAIGTLEAYSFIRKRSAEMGLDIHRLVHLATRNWLRKEKLLAHWTERVVARLLEVFPDDYYQNRSLWRRYMAHARYALDSSVINNCGENRTELAWKVGRCLYSDGQWKEAEDLDVLVMETRKRLLGHDHPNTLKSMGDLASTFWNQGRWKEAKDLDVQVMEMRKIVLGQEHPETLASMNNLAATCQSQGRLKEAEDLYILVMETRKRVLGQGDLDTLNSMSGLATTFWEQGRWKEAEDLDVQVMEMRKIVLGQEHPNTLTSIANLALTFWKQGRWKEAEDLFMSVAETSKRVVGQEHPETLRNMSNLAMVYRDQGRWKEAENLGVLVMEMRKRVLGQEHPETLKSMNNSATIYRSQGRWKEAEDLFILVMETRKRVLGQEHPDSLRSMGGSATTLWEQGRWKEAEDLFVVATGTSVKVLGQEHPDTLTFMATLASTYQNQGRWKEAEELDVLVMETRTRVLGQEHPDTLTSMANLASTYGFQARWKEAEELGVLARETRARLLGREHPDTLTSMANLAMAWRANNRHEEALKMLEECVTLRTRALGVDHPYTLRSTSTLLQWRREIGESPPPLT